MKSAAEPVAFTVLLGFVVLLSIFPQAMVSDDGPPGGVDVAFCPEVPRRARRRRSILWCNASMNAAWVFSPC